MKPVRVLEIVGGLNRGGVETWLLELARRLDRRRVAIDFVVHAAERGVYEDELAGLGARIWRVLHPRRPWSYAPALGRIAAGYDVVHSHMHLFSGLALRAAQSAGVSRRLVHSHTDTLSEDTAAPWPRQCYRALMQRWIRRHASAGFAASRQAAASLFGGRWERDPRWRLVPGAIDVERFAGETDRNAMRRQAGFAPDSLLVVHTGRLEPVKNQLFLIEAFDIARRREDRLRLVLLGDGSLRAALGRAIEDRGLTNRVVLAGGSAEVPAWLGSADLFVFPSLFEGLGLALVEAQAAGLPALVSDAVPEEADVAAALVRRLPLALGAPAWADAMLDAVRRGPALGRQQALARVRASDFSIERNLRVMEAAYLG